MWLDEESWNNIPDIETQREFVNTKLRDSDKFITMQDHKMEEIAVKAVYYMFHDPHAMPAQYDEMMIEDLIRFLVRKNYPELLNRNEWMPIVNQIYFEVTRLWIFLIPSSLDPKEFEYNAYLDLEPHAKFITNKKIFKILVTSLSTIMSRLHAIPYNVVSEPDFLRPFIYDAIAIEFNELLDGESDAAKEIFLNSLGYSSDYLISILVRVMLDEETTIPENN